MFHKQLNMKNNMYICRRLLSLLHRQNFQCRYVAFASYLKEPNLVPINYVEKWRVSSCMARIPRVHFCSSAKFSSDCHSHHVSAGNNATSYTDRSHLCGTLSVAQVNHKVTIVGWVDRVSLSFLKIYDWTGLVQVLLSSEWVDKLSTLNRDSVVLVTGTVKQRPEGQENRNMATGEIEILPDTIDVMNTCLSDRPLHPMSKIEPTDLVRLKYRYLDIRNKRMQGNLRLRSTLIMKMREFLCNQHGFVDVETPTLFRKTPGGAKEFIVPSKQRGKFYSLPQSPQQFKQLLMIGGIDRYFQVARCYRDERTTSDRQPEFTQLDIEMSFTSQQSIRCLIEDLLQYAWPSELGGIPERFPVMAYDAAIRDYGSDKPDTRFEMKLKDVTTFCKNCGNPFLEGASKVLAIKIPDGAKHFSNKEVESLLVSPLIEEENNVKMTPVRLKQDGQWRSSVGNTMSGESRQEITEALGIGHQDLVILGVGSGDSPNKVLGRVRLDTATQLEQKGVKVRDEGEFKFLWVTDFPLFLPKENKDGLESAHHPFTAPTEEDAELIYTDTDLTKVKSQHYDLVINGSEVGGGSVRIHNSALQKYILEHILKEDHTELNHLLEALELGCPPHAGIALGLDRLVAILCGEKSIRNVIAFPKNSEYKDVMSNAPTQIGEEELAAYHLQVL